jgi:hypothetical protein
MDLLEKLFEVGKRKHKYLFSGYKIHISYTFPSTVYMLQFKFYIKLMKGHVFSVIVKAKGLLKYRSCA